MSSNATTALATAFLVVVGVAQAGILVAQHRQHRLDLAEAYWRRWADCQRAWATVVFLGRDPGAYYQVADGPLVEELRVLVQQADSHAPSMWALRALSDTTGVLSDMALRVLNGRLSVGDAYAIFGTGFLRQSRPLRRLLDVPAVAPTDDDLKPERTDDAHYFVQTELQDWLIYHDGVRRRCLVLIDLLWSEAARLEDLPPEDLRMAANAKRRSGHLNRRRLWQECLRLRGPIGAPSALRLTRFLRHAEYRRRFGRIGLSQSRLDQLSAQWARRLLRDSQ